MAAEIDIITLDNFADKMPRWDPAGADPGDGSSHLYALVDMGSNGIRFSISDLAPPRARLLRCVYRERAAISLFDALSPGGAPAFPEGTIRAVAAAVARFRLVALEAYGVDPSRVSVLATEAVRRAANATALAAAVAGSAPGLRLQVLAPEVETLFGAAGARAGLAAPRGLFLDLGGGSVQVTYVDAAAAGPAGPEVDAARAGASLPFGAARLTRVLEDGGPEVRTAEQARLRDGLAAALRALEGRFPGLAEAARRARRAGAAEGVDLYLCGGGFRGYGSMLMHSDPVQPYPVPLVGSYTVPGAFFAQTARMRRANDEFGGKIHGMSKRRRRQFPAVATVVEALVAALPPIRSATFCAGGNREGALAMKLPPAVREADPLPLLRGVGRAAGGPALDAAYDAAELSVLGRLAGAVPAGVEAATVWSLGLGPVFVQGIWAGAGEDGSANAARALHDAVSRDPSFPGLTHLHRAVLGLTACARWGGSLAPADRERHRNLEALADAASPGASFWARYIGACAAALATVVPAWPADNGRAEVIGLDAKLSEDGGRVELVVSVHHRATTGIDLSDVQGLFKDVGKNKSSKRPGKAVVRVCEITI